MYNLEQVTSQFPHLKRREMIIIPLKVAEKLNVIAKLHHVKLLVLQVKSGQSLAISPGSTNVWKEPSTVPACGQGLLHPQNDFILTSQIRL